MDYQRATIQTLQRKQKNTETRIKTLTRAMRVFVNTPHYDVLHGVLTELQQINAELGYWCRVKSGQIP